LPPGGSPPGTARREPWASLGVGCRPAALLALIVTTLQPVDERNQLVQLREEQSPQLQEAMQFCERLQAMGSETARLADGGDATGKEIVDAMKQQGLTLEAPGKNGKSVSGKSVSAAFAGRCGSCFTSGGLPED
jgi:hypothetical protein